MDHRKNDIIQKLVPFEVKKKDFSQIAKELKDGWYISNIKPYQDIFICVLEKNLAPKSNLVDDINMSIKDLLQMAAIPKKTKKRQDA